jgi:hypothetical protein
MAGAAEIDINSAKLPYCRGYVATTTNGRLNADQGACMGRGRCNEGEATGHRVRSWFTMLRVVAVDRNHQLLKERTAMRKITIIIGLAAMLGGCVIVPVPVPVNTPPARN